MMRRAALAMILAALPLHAAEPRAVISGPVSGAVGERIWFDISGSASDEKYPIRVGADTFGGDGASVRVWYDDARHPGRAEMVAAKPGVYTVTVIALGVPEGKSDPDVAVKNWLIQVGVVPPPTPPPPGPGPNPPPPPPGPAPIPAPGLRVLIVCETADASRLPAGQRAILFGQEMRAFLNAKCVMGPDGKTREWRIWDPDLDVSGDTPVWQGAMKRPRASLPWLVISNGSAGYEGPLPATADEAKALISQYAGAAGHG